MPNGNDTSNDCTSSSNPCVTVQHAVDKAHQNDEIHVATGVYTGVEGRAGITQGVFIGKTVRVSGGYSSDFAVRDPLLYTTTLDAEGAGRVMVITDTITPIVEGLHLMGGDATGLGGYSGGGDAGGGLYIYTATVTISGCAVYSNTASTSIRDFNHGGGLYLYESDAMLRGNMVSNNIAIEGDGGGLYLAYSNATLRENTIDNNYAGHRGGGLHLQYSDAMLHNNAVVSNTSFVGAGLFLMSSEAVLSENTVGSNSANADSGGILLTLGSYSLVGNTITTNTTSFYGDGSGVSLGASNASLNGNAIAHNEAGDGGGLAIEADNDVTLTNDIVVNNEVDTAGSAFYIKGSLVRLLHTTIAHNFGGDGSAIYVSQYTESIMKYSTVSLTNTILASHTVGITVTAGSTATLDHTLWYSTGINTGGDGALSSTNAITGSPAFVDPATGNYHLSADSAAIEAGVSTSVTCDIDGDPRPIGPLPDLGADEVWLNQTYLPLVAKRYP